MDDSQQRSTPPSTKPPAKVTVTWAGGQRFDAGREGAPSARLDGKGETGPSPPESLLNALASCSAIDVVEVLAKRRTPVESIEVKVTGERVDTYPRRFTHITMDFRIAGAGIERAQAERAIDLSINKYCSVRASLDPGIPIDWTLDLGPDI